MEDKEWILKNVEEICADTRDVDEVCMALEHSTIFATEIIQNLTKTIEALQQENNGWRERYDELDAGHSRLFKDFCKLQQENERLKEQMKKLKKIEEYINEKLTYIDNAEDQETILKIIEGND